MTENNKRAAEVALASFDAAVALELPRVSHVEFDSHEICKHFAKELRIKFITELLKDLP